MALPNTEGMTPAHNSTKAFVRRLYHTVACDPPHFSHARGIFLLLLICLISLFGCEKKSHNEENSTRENSTSSGTRAAHERNLQHESNLEKESERSETSKSAHSDANTGDLDAIKKRGLIRFVRIGSVDDDMLHRITIVTRHHQELAEALAKNLGVEARWIKAKDPEEALTMLDSGDADVLAGNLTKTKMRAERYDLSETIKTSYKQLVAGREGPDIDKPDDLQNLRLVILNDSTYINTARTLQKNNPSVEMEVRDLSNIEDIDQIIDLLNQNPGWATILDTAVVSELTSYRNDMKGGAKVSGEEEIVWAMRKGSPKLKQQVDKLLSKTKVQAPEKSLPNWKAIKNTRVLRFLTYNGPTSYFMWKGILMGFDYDLAKEFAELHNIDLQVIAVPHDQSLIEWLQAGRGDFAGAALTISERRRQQGVDFSTPYREAAVQVLTNSDIPPINRLQDLHGRTLTLRAFSIFEGVAKNLQKQGIKVKIQLAPEDVSYERLINMVADGEVEATLVDANDAEVGSKLRDSLTAGPIVTDPLPQGWMVLKGNNSLRRKLDAFIKKYRRTESYQKKIAYYFQPGKSAGKRYLEKLQPGDDLSPYDELVKTEAKKYQFDWRIIIAQMWQESSFNPKAESSVGAQGLLQVMPLTAEDMGYPHPLTDPERGIKAGVKYLNWINGRFPASVSRENRIWFALAAYNAGIGHLYDAQRLAKKLQLDPNVWFDNVEWAMLKLSEPRYFKNARYGYVRGAEPVHYVNNISNLYRAYTEVMPLQGTWVPDRQPRTPHTSRLIWLARSCQYDHWTLSNGVSPKLPKAGSWQRSADEFSRSHNILLSSWEAVACARFP